MNRYVKKTIAVEAVKWKGFNNHEIEDFAGDNVKIEVIREGDADRGIPPCIDCSIKTLEGVMTANVGDYIIKGVNGEFYPCKPDIFEKTYLHEDEMGNISDGYHTFNELYRYRMLYNAAFFNELAKGDIKVCKSHKHHDGEECFGGGRAGDARKDGSQPPFYWVSRVYDHSMSRTNRTEEVRYLYRVNVRPLLNSTIHPELELCSELDQ